MEKLGKKSKGEALTLVFDACENMANCWPGLWQLLDKLCQNQESWRLTIVLAGSINKDFWLAMPPAIKKQLRLKVTLAPLTYLDSLPLLESFENEEKVLLYGMTGGYPAYLRLVDEKLTYKENLNKLFYTEQAPLNGAARKILQGKLREPATYHAILYSMAKGAQRMSAISLEVGMEMNKLSKYMKTLLDVNLVERINPVTAYKEQKQQKKTYYILKNNLLAFWYQFVFPYASMLALGRGGVIVRQRVLPKLDTYGAWIFRKICLQYCQTLTERQNFAFPYEALGYWWQGEAGLENSMLLAVQKQQVCCMLCVWENSKTNVDAIFKLLTMAEGLDYEKKYYLVFSKKHFLDNALAYSAQHKQFRLISLSYIK